MNTTTAALLLLTADRLARELHTSTEPVTLPQWETFDNTVYRCLHTLLGPGRKLTGHDSAEGSAAIRTFQHYPTPLRPAPGETYSPTEAARLIGSNTHRITRDAIAGRIHAERVDRALRIPAEELDHRPDLTAAMSTDAHPFSRLTVAIGAMTDVLAGHRVSAGAALTDDRQIAAAMRHVLSLAAVAARHTLHTGAVADLDRPLLIAQYADLAVDALDGRSGYPQLWTMTSTNPPAWSVSNRGSAVGRPAGVRMIEAVSVRAANAVRDAVTYSWVGGMPVVSPAHARSAPRRAVAALRSDSAPEALCWFSM